MIWERKILRKVHGPSHDHNYWRIKINQEIYKKFISPSSVAVIKVHRLKWFGHVLRMDDTRAGKELLDSKPGRGQKKGRTRLCGWILLNWASGIWVYRDENKRFGQNRWVVMEAKVKFKKPVLKKNWYIKQWVIVLTQCALYPKENYTNQATKIKTLFQM